MSLDRKDIRAKLDPDVHKALCLLCEVDQLDLSEFVERELIRVIEHRVHAAQYIAANSPSLGFAGKVSGKRGSPRE
jgi:hypothetical protein